MRRKGTGPATTRTGRRSCTDRRRLNRCRRSSPTQPACMCWARGTRSTTSPSSERNWAGNYTYRAEKLHRPTTIEQVQEIVANAASVHVLGSRHSFNDITELGKELGRQLHVPGGEAAPTDDD